MIYDMQMFMWRLWMFFAGLEWYEVVCGFPLLLYGLLIILGVFVQMFESMDDEVFDDRVFDDKIDNFVPITPHWDEQGYAVFPSGPPGLKTRDLPELPTGQPWRAPIECSWSDASRLGERRSARLPEDAPKLLPGRWRVVE